MSFARAFHRPWVFVTVPAIAIAALFAVGMLQGLAIMPVESRIERMGGEFTVRYDTYDAFGHRATRRTLYHQEGRKLRLVRKRIVAFTVNPYKLNSALYEYCPGEEHKDCGIHYYDGDTRRTRKVSSQRILGNADSYGPWSADGRFVVLAAQYKIELIDLKSGQSKDMAELLALAEGRRWVDVESWSNDQRKFTVRVGEYIAGAAPPRRIKEELIVIDAYDGSVSSVATGQPPGFPR